MLTLDCEDSNPSSLTFLIQSVITAGAAQLILPYPSTHARTCHQFFLTSHLAAATTTFTYTVQHHLSIYGHVCNWKPCSDVFGSILGYFGSPFFTSCTDSTYIQLVFLFPSSFVHKSTTADAPQLLGIDMAHLHGHRLYFSL